MLNSLGATFTAHAIGSVAFLYALNLPAAVWIGLIPVVFLERGLFAIGTWASYLVFNSVLSRLTVYVNIKNLKINRDYIWSWKFLKRFS